MSAVRVLYGEAEQRNLLTRFMKILEDQKGHEIASLVEAAKIELSDNQSASLDIGFIEDGWTIDTNQIDLNKATKAEVEKIISTGLHTVEQGAGINPTVIDTIFMTGGSTALPGFVSSVQAAFPSSKIMQGDRFSSVATGLGISAARLYNR